MRTMIGKDLKFPMLFAVALLILGLQPGWAQSSDEDIQALRKEVNAIKASQDAVALDIIDGFLSPPQEEPKEKAAQKPPAKPNGAGGNLASLLI